MSGLPGLEVDQVTVRFGGLTAVDDVSLHAAAGSITGLIGPNGAGKTTTFNACTGAVPVAGGHVALGEVRLDRHGVDWRASHGLGRTFQRMELFDSMTVAENVALGPEAMYSARRLWGQFFSSPRQNAEIRERTTEALDRCGLMHLAGHVAGDLSTGQRRLVELARAIATPFLFLLLDEPSSGLDNRESEQFAEVLQTFVAETGIGILLVEHDMALVSNVCDHVYVLDFGRLIFEGTTTEMMASPVVRAAYLGSDAIEGPEEGLSGEAEVAGV